MKLNLCSITKIKKTSNIVMKNYNNTRQDVLGQINVVYEFKCPKPYDQVANYIGFYDYFEC